MTLELETGDIDLDHSALITANGSKTVSLQFAILWIAARLGKSPQNWPYIRIIRISSEFFRIVSAPLTVPVNTCAPRHWVKEFFHQPFEQGSLFHKWPPFLSKKLYSRIVYKHRDSMVFHVDSSSRKISRCDLKTFYWLTRVASFLAEPLGKDKKVKSLKWQTLKAQLLWQRLAKHKKLAMSCIMKQWYWGCFNIWMSSRILLVSLLILILIHTSWCLSVFMEVWRIYVARIMNWWKVILEALGYKSWRSCNWCTRWTWHMEIWKRRIWQWQVSNHSRFQIELDWVASSACFLQAFATFLTDAFVSSVPFQGTHVLC